MFDLKVIEFKKKLITDINNSGLPLTVLHYILKEVLEMIDEGLTNQIRMEQEQRAQDNNTDLGLVDVNINEEC